MKANKTLITSLIIAILLLLVGFGCASCGSRKSETTKTTDKTNSVELSKGEEKTAVKSNETNLDIDKSKIIVTEKVEETPGVKITTKTTETQNDKTKTSTKIVEKNVYKNWDIHKTITVYKSVKSKVVDKKEASKTWLVWIASILGFLVMAYFLIRRWFKF